MIGRRLYRQLLGGFLLVAVTAIVTAGVSVRLVTRTRAPVPPFLGEAVLQLTEDLPSEPASRRRELRRRAARFDGEVAVFDAQGRPVEGTAHLEPPRRHSTHWRHSRRGYGLVVARPDGSMVVLEREREQDPLWERAHILVLLSVFSVVAAGSMLLARRITRRLENLRDSVDLLGAGDLTARVRVEGKDEVAELARSFNAAAARIETLVQSQQRVLAGASHELRSPLARLTMATELLAVTEDEAARTKLAAEIDRDIQELDALIGELLSSSRLEAAGLERVPLELAALVHEEAARVEAEVELEALPQVRADPRLLRRAVRNLLENAVRHGERPVHITAAANAGVVRIVVSDAGPGVPEAEREHIFEPFYRASGHAEADGGVGLGLALVARIAAAHGGQVRCEGARFVLELPV